MGPDPRVDPMTASRWRPNLPEWVQFPRVIWFVIEGIAVGTAGLLLREALAPAQAAVTVGNIAFFVGGTTALLGIVAYLVLVLANR